MMPQSRIAWLVAVVAGLSGTWAHAGPKPRTEKRDAAADEVKLVLQREQHAPLDRRATLSTLLQRQPDLAVARWQSGYVDRSNSWRSYADSPDAELLAKLASYRPRRAGVRDRVRDQLALAAWCQREGLRDQERVHRMAAAALAEPDQQAEILRSMGYRRAGAQWLSPQEFDDWQRWTRAAREGQNRWAKEIEGLVAQFRGNGRQRESARAGLARIHDPAAIPALEAALSSNQVSETMLFIELLADLPSYEASLALARVAVFSEWKDTREAASRILRSRRLEDFAPPLIQLLATVETRVQVRPVLLGFVSYKLLAVQHTHDTIRVSRTTLRSGFSVEYDSGLIVDDPVGAETMLPSDILMDSLARLSDSDRIQADFVHRWESSTERQRELTQRINDRVVRVLSTVSGEDRSTDPEFWWNWWANTADVHAAAKRIVDEENVFRPLPGVLIHRSCFQAGTPVWTETGPVAIELIKPGDRVLSQNAETGELAYKPVLHKSLGPARKLIRVTAGGETLICTDGHRFWVAGEAWLKARELAPKKLLHTATASIPVESVSEGPTDETHNLVVADFHSYFVGNQAFLVQDLPLPRSTNCVVPGLQPEW